MSHNLINTIIPIANEMWANAERDGRPTKLCDGAQTAIFDFFASCIFSEPRAARFRPVSEIRTKATPCVEI